MRLGAWYGFAEFKLDKHAKLQADNGKGLKQHHIELDVRECR